MPISVSLPPSLQFTPEGCRYVPPSAPGYSTEMKDSSRLEHLFPDGEVWRKLRGGNGKTDNVSGSS